jgi:hypothetical protein
MHSDEVAALLEPYDAPIVALTGRLRDFLKEAMPDAIEEPDTSAKLIGYTFRPGTYKGLVAAIAPQKSYVNLMFSKGTELLEADKTGLLEGSGKKARHIKVHDEGRLADPAVRGLVMEAAARTRETL